MILVLDDGEEVPVGEASESSWHEDCDATGCYGHRDDQGNGNQYGDGGCSYSMVDGPGANLTGTRKSIFGLKGFPKRKFVGFKVEVEHKFWFEIIDTCNGNEVVWISTLELSCKGFVRYTSKAKPPWTIE